MNNNTTGENNRQDMKTSTADTSPSLSSSSPILNLNKDRMTQIFFDLVVIVFVIILLVIVTKNIDPKISGFYCNENDLFYPYKSYSISNLTLMIAGTFVPILVILMIELINILAFFKANSTTTLTRRKQFFIITFHAISLFLLGLGITLLLNEIGKRWFGRLKPHFIDVCKPNLSQINCTYNVGNDKFYNFISTGGSFCTGSIEEIKEARQSFPASHSSFASFSMIYLILYIQARFIVLRIRFVKPLLQTIALMVAYIVSTSPINDHQHHISDVFAGAFLGTLIAIHSSCVTGKVIWLFASRTDYFDLDLKRITKSSVIEAEVKQP